MPSDPVVVSISLSAEERAALETLLRLHGTWATIAKLAREQGATLAEATPLSLGAQGEYLNSDQLSSVRQVLTALPWPGKPKLPKFDHRDWLLSQLVTTNNHGGMWARRYLKLPRPLTADELRELLNFVAVPSLKAWLEGEYLVLAHKGEGAAR